MLTSQSRAHLLVIDVQERLAPNVENPERVISNCGRLITYARRLDVPITFTEQYPRGLGPTTGILLELTGNSIPRIEKTEFSVWRNPGIRARLEEVARQGRRQVIVAGMEAHICVLQTVMDLIANDFDVFVVADAISSRVPQSRDLAIDRMARAGAAIVNHEMVGFEWLERAGTPEFKDLISVIK